MNYLSEKSSIGIKQAVLLAITLIFVLNSGSLIAKPLKIYILAGQSNMVGVGGISTFDYIGDDPATESLLKDMRGADGELRICDRVWISSLNGKMNQYGGEGFGKLTAGYGFRGDTPSEPGIYIGPEFTFGITMEKAYDGPILIIKTAWGGQNLSADFRSPSAGPYELNDWQVEFYTNRGTLEKVKTQKKEATGRNYRYMVEHVKKVLSDIKRVYPDYDPKQGYELSGFVWFQGWNDFSDTRTYLSQYGEKQYDLYSDLLSHFIRDVRKDLNAPKMPFVIGVMGQFGSFTPGTFNAAGNKESRMKCFRKAMEAPTKLDEFKGNVVAVQTSPFWEDELAAIGMKHLKIKQMRARLKNKNKGFANEDGEMTAKQLKEYLAQYRAEIISPQEEGFWKRAVSIGGDIHYFGSAKFYAQAGKAFAEALLQIGQADESIKGVKDDQLFNAAGNAVRAKVTDVSFKYTPANNLGPDKIVMRRDPSDIIKDNGLYYLWYTKGAFAHGYDATIWYATSPDGKTWTEKGEALARGPVGSWDEQSVFTPNILVAEGKYWLFYTAVPKPFSNKKPDITKTAIGIAVSDSPNGPWKKLSSNPVLKASDDHSEFDSLRVDDACLIVREGKYWLYYKGRQWDKGYWQTQMGVAIADKPEGPYIKNSTNPIITGGHEVLVWPYGKGVVALIGGIGSKDVQRTLQYSDDGIKFSKMIEMKQRRLPNGGGAYRPEAFTDSGRGEMFEWGVHIGGKRGFLPFIERFDSVWKSE